jgi:hypothetical protein
MSKIMVQTMANNRFRVLLGRFKERSASRCPIPEAALDPLAHFTLVI